MKVIGYTRVSTEDYRLQAVKYVERRLQAVERIVDDSKILSYSVKESIDGLPFSSVDESIGYMCKELDYLKSFDFKGKQREKYDRFDDLPPIY